MNHLSVVGNLVRSDVIVGLLVVVSEVIPVSIVPVVVSKSVSLGQGVNRSRFGVEIVGYNLRRSLCLFILNVLIFLDKPLSLLLLEDLVMFANLWLWLPDLLGSLAGGNHRSSLRHLLTLSLVLLLDNVAFRLLSLQHLLGFIHFFLSFVHGSLNHELGLIHVCLNLRGHVFMVLHLVVLVLRILDLVI